MGAGRNGGGCGLVEHALAGLLKGEGSHEAIVPTAARKEDCAGRSVDAVMIRGGAAR